MIQTYSALVVDEHLDVRERLPVEHEVLPLPDRVVHIKVPLTQQILVQVQLLQIPVVRSEAGVDRVEPNKTGRLGSVWATSAFLSRGAGVPWSGSPVGRD